MVTATTPPVVRADAEGERRWFFGGGEHTWKVHADETDGAFFLFEDRMEQGKMTPLHTHPESDETMYVLEGEILMHLDGREHRVGAGGRRGPARATARLHGAVADREMLCLHTPGSCEAFYREASEPGSSGVAASGPVDFDRVRASAERNGGIQLLGPPPFAS